MNGHEPVCRHLLIEMGGIAFDPTLRGPALQRLFAGAVASAGATIVRSFCVEFHPQGETVILVLRESHAILSTWPEHRVAMVDVCTCGHSVDFDMLINSLIDELAPEWVHSRVLPRDGRAPSVTHSTPQSMTPSA